MRSMVLGVLGGIGSGKSTVTRLLIERGAAAVDADRLAHAALESEAVRMRLRERWGDRALRADGSVDRDEVAARVFADAAEREFLEGLVHPRVRSEIAARVDAFRAANDGPSVLVLDVPLLAESPLLTLCDELVFVVAPDEARQARVRERGWTDDELARREAAQTPINEKRRMARWTIDNSGDIAATRRAVERLWGELCSARSSENEGAPAGEGPPATGGEERSER